MSASPEAGSSRNGSRSAEIGDRGRGRRAISCALLVACAAVAPPALANVAPQAWPDSATLAEDTTVDLVVTANDTDPDGDVVKLALSPIIEAPALGTATRISATTIRYTPFANVSGTDRFRYRIHDGNGHVDSALVNLTINPVNDKPVGVNDSASTSEEVAVSIVVTANDTDVDGDTVTLITSPIVAAPAHGTATKVNGSTISYTPHTNFSGTDTFQYEAGDGHGARTRAWVTVSVAGVNDPPVAQPDSATTNEDTAITLTVTANDSDPDGDLVKLALSPIIEAPTLGTATRVSDSQIRYTPAANRSGTDRFRYRIHDGKGAVDSALVTVTIVEVNDPPTAVADAVSTPEDTAVSVVVTANDTDVEGDTITLITSPIVTAPANGTAVKVSGTTIRYTPNANFSGSDGFRYEVGDNRGGRSRAWVTVTVVGANDPPVAQPDSATTNEDTAITLTVTANDSDADGDVVKLALSPILLAPTLGTATRLNDTQIRYTPNANAFGSDQLRYRITDGNGAVDSALVSLTIVEVNDAPVALPDSVSVQVGESVDVVVTANDSDVDGDAVLLITSPIVVPPADGTATKLSGSTIRYTPAAGFRGSDSFEYEIGDGRGLRARALVTVTVENRPPVANDDAGTTQMSTQVVIDVVANDSDPDGDPVTLISSPVVTPPANGAAVKVSGTSIAYTPKTAFTGTDTFQYEVGDGRGSRARAWVTVTVAQEPAEIRVVRAWEDPVEVAAGSTFEFPDVELGEPESRLFRIYNDGDGALEVRNSDALVGGACFSQIEDPAPVVPAGGSTTFRVRLLCNTPQRASGTVTIETNDPDEPTYGFSLRGAVGLALPPIRVLAPDGSEVPHEGVFTLPETAVGTPISRLLTIVNEGGAPLGLADPGGLVRGEGFHEIEVPATPIPAPGQSTFRVRLLHGQPGSYTGQVVIEPSDAAYKSYRFTLRGDVGHPDFELAADPAQRSIERGKGKSFTVTVTPRFLFAEPVTLSVGGLPEGAMAWWKPDDVLLSGTATLTVTTSLSTPLGSYGLTISGAGGGKVHSMPVTIHVWEPVSTDFTLDVSPDAATVVRGGGVDYSVTLTADAGFSGAAGLSVSGLPAGVTHTIEPPSIGNGGTALIRVATLPDTVEGSYELTVTGTAGAETRTALASLLVRPPAAPGEPVIDSMTPELFDGGGVRVVTLFGRSFQGATVTVAQENPDADSSATRVFPAVGSVTVNADGTRIDVEIDSSDPRVMDFYNLVVDNGVAEASSPSFRVVPAGPVVDLVTPNRPEAGGGTYVLTLAGYHLRNVSVRAEPAGVLELIGVDTTDDRHVNGLLRVAPGAGTGPVDLVVTDPQGRTARIELTVVANGAAQSATRALATQRVDPETLAPVAGRAPTIFFQELAVRRLNATEVDPDGGIRVRAASLDRAAEDAFTFRVYLSYTVNLFQFYWARAFVFDPVTGEIGDAILQGLGLGEKVRFGAFVLSFYLRVDLTIDIFIGNTGFTWPRFCIRIAAAVQIPGFDGFYEEWDYCRGGGFVPFNTGSTSSMTARGGECASVVQEAPVAEGLVFAEAEQVACCHQPIAVEASGVAFAGAPFAFGFNLQTPNAGTATPGAQCQCSIVAQPACVVKGKQQTYSASGNPGGGSFQWRVAKGSGVTLVSGASTDTVSVRGDTTSAAAGDVALEVSYTVGGSTCKQLVELSVVDVDGPWEFKTSDSADSQNAVANNFTSVGMPTLGAVTPGNPPGTNGFHQNMQIKARILPCDPALRCRFDFNRTRQGTVVLVQPNKPLSFGPNNCPNGSCDDEGNGDTDEDLQVDAAPACGIYVIDAPGLGVGSQTGACEPQSVDAVLASCLNFTEWLEVDGVPVGADFRWFAETRIRCNGSTFQYDLGTQRNRIGTGITDCSEQRVAVP